MSSIKEIIEAESKELSDGQRANLHLHREGSFYRAYEWSAFLACRYLHEFKVTKRVFKGLEQPLVYIRFSEASILISYIFLKVGIVPPLVCLF